MLLFICIYSNTELRFFLANRHLLPRQIVLNLLSDCFFCKAQYNFHRDNQKNLAFLYIFFAPFTNKSLWNTENGKAATMITLSGAALNVFVNGKPSYFTGLLSKCQCWPAGGARDRMIPQSSDNTWCEEGDAATCIWLHHWGMWVFHTRIKYLR